MSSASWIRIWNVGLASMLLAIASPVAATVAAVEVADMRLAIAEADPAIAFADIANGQARIGFNPLVGRGLTLVAPPGKTLWLRLRLDLPEDGARRYISLSRQSIDHVHLYSGPSSDRPGAGAGIAGSAVAPAARARWPDAFLLPVPVDAVGASTLYLQVQGKGTLNLQPRLVAAELAEANASSASRSYQLLYVALLLVALSSIIRRLMGREGSFRLALAALACLAASMADNHHLPVSLLGGAIVENGNLPVALWILACAALLRASAQYAGLEKISPAVAVAIDRLSIVFLVMAAGAMFVPPAFLTQLQFAGLCLLATTAVISGASLLLDPRHWRWTPLMVWIGMLPALLAIPLSMAQVIPDSFLVRRGFQLLLGLQLVVYLVLPWIRQALQEREKSKRAVVVGPTAEEKIAQAREMVVSSLQAGIESAARGDMEWIAYRRLMAGLRPVLPQTAAAVVAMNYHNEDLFLVEPKEAEARFRMLLSQRGSLMKNLSRSLAPQQIVIDFDGPEGPLQHVMLAIIPLPIDRPGWGALIIERDAEAVYSDEELDLCAEFAALATTAADEAALVLQMRHAKEIDADSGAFKAEMIEQLLRKAHEQSTHKRIPLSVLRIGMDDFGGLPADVGAHLARQVADAIREETDYGETIGRQSPDEFLVLLAGRAIGDARLLADRICAQLRNQALPTREGAILTLSVGASQLLPGERTPQLMIDRSEKALAKARMYGGNQVQAIAGGTTS